MLRELIRDAYRLVAMDPSRASFTVQRRVLLRYAEIAIGIQKLQNTDSPPNGNAFCISTTRRLPQRRRLLADRSASVQSHR